MKIVRVDYYHSRIPWYKKDTKKGKPDPTYFYRYPRGWRKACGLVEATLKGIKTTSPCTRGGHTICTLTTEDELFGQQYWIGIALCSMADNFCYKTGRNLSFQRALATMQHRYYEGYYE